MNRLIEKLMPEDTRTGDVAGGSLWPWEVFGHYCF